MYGSTVQNGTPTPTSPIELKSIGDSGSYEVGVYGKNLIEYPFYTTTKTTNGVTFTDLGDGRIKVNGTPTQETGFAFKVDGVKDFTLKKGVAYTLSITKDKDVSLYAYLTTDETTVHTINKPTVVFSQDTKAKIIALITLKDVTYNDVIVKVQFEQSPQATPYEPYKAKQTLTLTDTLRSVGDIADEKDFARGVTTQRFKVVDLSTLNWRKTATYWYCIDLQSQIYKDYNNPKILAEKYVAKGWYIEDNEKAIKINGAGSICVFNTDLTVTPSGLVIYALAEPIETPLTETELNDYRQLMTNKGTTTILSEAEVEVDYYINKPNAQAIGNIHSQLNKDYFKLQQAIIETGGN